VTDPAEQINHYTGELIDRIGGVGHCDAIRGRHADHTCMCRRTDLHRAHECACGKSWGSE
jgi:hypothetical protein